MKCRTTEWILWALAMIVFLWLTLSGRTRDLGLAIAAVAVLWYVVVPASVLDENSRGKIREP